MLTSSNGDISALLALCAGNSPVPGEFPTQRPVTRSFDVFVDRRLNKRLDKQSWGWWFETLSRPFRRHCNVCRYSYYAETRILDWYLYISSCFCIDLSTANIETHEIYHTLLCTSFDIDKQYSKKWIDHSIVSPILPGQKYSFSWSAMTLLLVLFTNYILILVPALRQGNDVYKLNRSCDFVPIITRIQNIISNGASSYWIWMNFSLLFYDGFYGFIIWMQISNLG